MSVTKKEMEADPMARKPKRKPSRRSKRAGNDLLNYKQMHALSKELRVRILAIFCERIASPKELSEELDEGLSQVSYHVGVLRECRLIEEVEKVPRRGTVEHYYRAVSPTLIPPDAWSQLPPAARKSVSTAILHTFFEDAIAAMEAGSFDDPPGELSWTPLVLDPIGIEKFGRLTRDFLEAVLELQAAASERQPTGNGEAVDAAAATVFLASFLSARSPAEGKKASATKRR